MKLQVAFLALYDLGFPTVTPSCPARQDSKAGFTVNELPDLGIGLNFS